MYAMTRPSHVAAILPGCISLSQKRTEPPTFNSHTAYHSLLQQAAEVTAAAAVRVRAWPSLMGCCAPSLKEHMLLQGWVWDVGTGVTALGTGAAAQQHIGKLCHDRR